MKNDAIIMNEHLFKHNFSFYSKDNNIMKVNHSSSYILLELNKKTFVYCYNLKRCVYFIIIYDVFLKN